jgi:hypothetical protein
MGSFKQRVWPYKALATYATVCKIGPTGIDMASTFESAEAILTGVARPVGGRGENKLE